MSRLQEIVDGQADAVFEYVAEGGSANSADEDGVSLVQWCAYYGDVSAIKFLLANGATLATLGTERTGSIRRRDAVKFVGEAGRLNERFG